MPATTTRGRRRRHEPDRALPRLGSPLGSWGGPGTDLGRFHFGAGGGNDAAAGGGLAASGSMLYIVDRATTASCASTTRAATGPRSCRRDAAEPARRLAVRGTRMLVADDQHHRVAAFDTGGHSLAHRRRPGAGPGQLNFPYGVAIDPQGRVFVADDLNHRVVRYSTPATGYKYKARWGAYGTSPGRLAFPRGAATNANGELFVANTGNDRIDVFDASGQLSARSAARAVPAASSTRRSASPPTERPARGHRRGQRPRPGARPRRLGRHDLGLAEPGPDDPARPGRGRLRRRRQRLRPRRPPQPIVVFDRAAGWRSTIGSQGSGPGQLLAPRPRHRRRGNINVADTGNDRIARFGTAATTWARSPRRAGVRGIAVAPDGSRHLRRRRQPHPRPDAGGTELDDFGGTGAARQAQHACADDARPGRQLWVADRGNNRVSSSAPTASGWRFRRARDGNGQLIRPTGVSVDCRGTLTVTDSENNRVSSSPSPRRCGARPLCATLPAPAPPAPPKLPTRPDARGPQSRRPGLRTSRCSARGPADPRRLRHRCATSPSASASPRAPPRPADASA